MFNCYVRPGKINGKVKIRPLANFPQTDTDVYSPDWSGWNTHLENFPLFNFWPHKSRGIYGRSFNKLGITSIITSIANNYPNILNSY